MIPIPEETPGAVGGPPISDALAMFTARHEFRKG